MSTITCRAVTKAFGDAVVIDHLDLEVRDGAVVTLIGESGTGKTTLLRLIAGFERPDAGTIRLDDEIVDSPERFVAPDKRRIGFMAQEGNLFPHLTVDRNIGFGLTRAERSGTRINELLDLVGLSGLGSRYPHQLSGGQQQRVALARALAPRPRLVLLDEPFSSLDPSLRTSLRADVMRILRDQHATVLLVTHDQSEALSVSDLVGIIRDRQVRQLATPETIYNQPVDIPIAQFLGEANLIAGNAIDGAMHTFIGDLRLTGGGRSLAGPATALVRPEQILLHPATAGDQIAGRATGNVVDREYYGHDCMLVIQTKCGPTVRARCSGQSSPHVGDTVFISVTGDFLAWPASTTT